jgi:hypothetical protein
MSEHWFWTSLQVPSPPDSCRWFDSLKWAIAVCDPNDPDLRNLARAYADLLQMGQMPARWHEFAYRVVSRLQYAYDHGVLRCQSRPSPTNIDLAQLAPAGRA